MVASPSPTPACERTPRTPVQLSWPRCLPYSTPKSSSSSNISSTPRSVERHLTEGKRALKSIHFRISLALFTVGTLFLIGRLTLTYFWLLIVKFQHDESDIPLSLVMMRLIIGFLASMPSVMFGMIQRRCKNATRCVLLAQIALLVPMAYESIKFLDWHIRNVSKGVCVQFAHEAPLSTCYTWIAFQFLKLFLSIYCAAAFVYAMFCSSSMQMQKAMWRTLTAMFVVSTFGVIVVALPFTFIEHNVHAAMYGVFGDGVALYFAMSPRLRELVQARVRDMLVARSSLMAAAGVAGLIGDRSPKQALTEAASRFRSISLSELTFEDMNCNSCVLDHNLYEISSPTKLQACDAFISHSWHDDPKAKWDELQRWRWKFVEHHNREPSVWFDKCCLDQVNIDADLRCLPIFLSACQRLVVLCGTTYLSRLWCIAEIFTFVHMGGSPDKIHWVPVLREGQEVNDVEAINKAMNEFDAAQCECSVADDKENIFSIIRAAYGSIDGFCQVVRGVFAEICVRHSV